jgi:hypothetical protein
MERSDIEIENSKLETGSEAYKARRIEHRVVKFSHEPNLFKNLSRSTQKYLQSEAVLEKNEIPVYGFIDNEETWIFATTRRLIWARPGFKKALHYGDIKIVCAPQWTERYAEFLKEQDNVTVEERPARYQINKMALSKLVIQDKKGLEHTLHWNPDEIDSIWEIVTFSANLDRIHRGDFQTKLFAFLRKRLGL